MQADAGKPTAVRLVRRALADVADVPTPARVAQALALIEGANRLGLRYGRWAAQNLFFEIWGRHPGARAELAPLGDALGFRLRPEGEG